MSLMTYEQALDYIHSTVRFGSKPGLKRIEGLLDALGNPQEKLRFVHVAGTNGKGSTCAMTAAVLQKAGYKTGLYISPYVEDFRERIQIDREMIPRSRLAELTGHIAGMIERVVASGGWQPTEFEIITALAMLYFSQEGCDLVVLEVGLGGRFDATNIIPPPLVAAIAPISVDHSAYLGDTIEDIAFEKCGIIKPGCVAVTCAGQASDAMRVIEDACRKKNVPLLAPDEGKLSFHDAGLEGSHFAYDGLEVSIGLRGAHQIQNALTALQIVRALRMQGVIIPDKAVRDGLAGTEWNGRFEVVRRSPLCITDGAHNPDAMAVLCAAIDSLLAGKRLVAVMAMMADKDYASCVPMLARRCAALVAVQVDLPRVLAAEKLAETAGQYCAAVYHDADIASGVRRALALADEDSAVLACGSLYMIGEAKRVFMEDMHNTNKSSDGGSRSREAYQ